MPGINPKIRAWARRNDFEHLIDRRLIGWLWPAEHERLVARLKRDHPKQAAHLAPHILPPVALQPGEERHPYFVA